MPGSDMPVKVEGPKLNDRAERLDKAINEQRDLINQLQNAAHDLLNKRKPETGEESAKPPPSSDFVMGFTDQISRIESHNYLLKQIYDHLRDVI